MLKVTSVYYHWNDLDDLFYRLQFCRDFSAYFYKNVQDGGASINFVIGGFDGLPDILLKKYPSLSLSKMTWTHQMARLLLIEQIYRATEIYKGSGYHKD